MIVNRYVVKLLPAVVIIFVTLIYLNNLSRSVYGGDVGDLVTAAFVMGVAHPPGYPTFTILGYFLSHLWFVPTPAYGVGLISVFSSIVFLYFYYLLSLRATKNINISILSTLIVAFSYLFWFYSEIAEVFALNNLFAIIIFYFALRFYESKKIKFYFVLLFFIGLSFTHHHTIVLILPSVFFLLLKRKQIILKDKKNILFFIIVLLLGFTPYVYVPFAASNNPVINWDNANNLQNFIHLVLRRDYGTFSAGNFPNASHLARLIILKTYIISILSSMTLPIFIVSCLGVLKLYRINKNIFVSFLSAFILSGPVFLYYAGFPVYSTFTIGVSERFYLLSYLIFLFFLPYGFLLIKEFFNLVFSKKIYSSVLICVFYLVVVMLLKYNFPKTNLSQNMIGDNFAADILSTLPDKSTILLSGDTRMFNVWYARYVLKKREDVELFTVSGVGSGGNIIRYIKKYGGKIGGRNDEALSWEKIILEINKIYRVFSVEQIKIDEKDFVWVPWGLSSKLVRRDDILSRDEYVREIEKIWQKLHIPYRGEMKIEEKSLLSSDIPMYYSKALVRTGNFLYTSYKDVDEAMKYYKRAIRVDPLESSAFASLAYIYYDEFKQCEKSEESVINALELNPGKKYYYVLLYFTYKDCYKDDDKAKKVVIEFKKKFSKNLSDEVESLLEIEKE